MKLTMKPECTVRLKTKGTGTEGALPRHLGRMVRLAAHRDRFPKSLPEVKVPPSAPKQDRDRRTVWFLGRGGEDRSISEKRVTGFTAENLWVFANHKPDSIPINIQSICPECGCRIGKRTNHKYCAMNYLRIFPITLEDASRPKTKVISINKSVISGFNLATKRFLLSTAFLGTTLANTVIADTDNPALEFQGKITTVAYNLLTGVTNHFASYDFVIHLVGNQWRIITLDTQAAQGAQINAERMEISFDGRDLYGLVHFPRHVLGEYRSRDKADYPAEFGHVNEGDFPFIAGPVQKTLWLAYCSAAYFSALVSNLMPSFLDLSLAKDPALARVTFELFSGRGSLPRLFNEYAPGKYGAIVNGELVQMPCPPPYDQEYLTFRYETEEITNHAGAFFPVRFRTEYFRPIVRAGKEPVNGIVALQKGLLKTLQLVGGVGDLRPNFTSEAIVRDTRFPELAKAPVLAYRESQPTWLDRNSPTLNREIATKPRVQPRPGQRTHPTITGWLRWTFGALLGGLLLAPVFFAIRQMRKERWIQKHTLPENHP